MPNPITIFTPAIYGLPIWAGALIVLFLALVIMGTAQSSYARYRQPESPWRGIFSGGFLAIVGCLTMLSAPTFGSIVAWRLGLGAGSFFIDAGVAIVAATLFAQYGQRAAQAK